jgi:hypothetical protein
VQKASFSFILSPPQSFPVCAEYAASVSTLRSLHEREILTKREMEKEIRKFVQTLNTLMVDAFWRQDLELIFIEDYEKPSKFLHSEVVVTEESIRKANELLSKVPEGSTVELPE